MPGINSKQCIKLLIVDDDPEIITLYKDILKDSNFTFATATCAKETFTKLDKGNFDLMLLDLKLPDMYGMDILKEVSVNYKDLSVIIITGNPTVESMIEAIRSGAYDYIIKPFHMDDFIISIQRAVEKIILIKENQRLIEELDQRDKLLEKRIKDLEEQIKKLKGK